MAAIHFRGFIFFSALIPAVIYAVVAVVLVSILSSRVQEDQIYLMWVLVSCITFSSIFKMGKDAPLLMKNAIASNKFHVANEDRPLLDSFSRTPKIRKFYPFLFGVALLSSIVISIISWSISEIVQTNQWQFYLLAVTVLPVTLFLSLFVINIKAYLSIDNEAPWVKPMGIEKLVRNWFVLPESISFLVINLSILLPLYSISEQSIENQVVTIVIVSLVTTAFLFLTINSDVKNHVSGLIHYDEGREISKSEHQLNLNSIEAGPKAYKIKKFSYWKWMPIILAFQLMLFATTKYVFVGQWFYIFVFLIEVFWLVIFSLMRSSVVLDTYRKIVYFRYPRSLEEKQKIGGFEPYDVQSK